jgi:hypothetical protein
MGGELLFAAGLAFSDDVFESFFPEVRVEFFRVELDGGGSALVGDQVEAWLGEL